MGAPQRKAHQRIGRVRAQQYNAELQRIRKTHGGRLTTRVVVEEARSKSNVLHDWFDWDQRRCAERDLLRQANALMQEVELVIETVGDHRPVRGWLSVVKDGERQYMPTVEVARSQNLSAQYISEARSILEGWLDRFKTMKKLMPAARHAKAAIRAIPSEDKEET